jgi:AraC-like DNA-binding protein
MPNAYKNLHHIFQSLFGQRKEGHKQPTLCQSSHLWTETLQAAIDKGHPANWLTGSRTYEKCPADAAFVRRVARIIEQHLADSDLQVERLSREIGLSRVHLYRKIKAATGLSPSAYIRNYRLRQAARLLHEGHCSVSDAAYRTGFNDLSHFSKCFKKAFGICPSAYPITEYAGPKS